jgi:diguanylate cyclase (GGDEF)-like protein
MAWGRPRSHLRVGRVDQDLGWWPLAGVMLVGGAVCIVAALWSPAPRTPPVPALACGVVLVGFALAMAAFRHVSPIRDLALWAWLAASVIMLGQMATLAEQVLVANALVLAALYAATCVTGWRLAVYLAAAVTGLTGAMVVSPAGFWPIPWAAVVATVLLTGTVTARHLHTLRQVASTDPLTGALNRAALRTATEVLLAASHRRGMPLSLALVDLDRFKEINDTRGHAAGDRLLIDVVASWRSRLREQDLVARFGGDEFVLILPDTTEAGAESVLEELRVGSPADWTAGIATARRSDTLESLLGRADAELYLHKHGRDGLPEAALS